MFHQQVTEQPGCPILATLHLRCMCMLAVASCACLTLRSCVCRRRVQRPGHQGSPCAVPEFEADTSVAGKCSGLADAYACALSKLLQKQQQTTDQQQICSHASVGTARPSCLSILIRIRGLSSSRSAPCDLRVRCGRSQPVATLARLSRRRIRYELMRIRLWLQGQRMRDRSERRS